MKTILKWPGGKERELPIIRKNLPTFTGRFIEPFVGGGAVFFDIDTKNCYINDKSDELINLYQCIKYKDVEFIYILQKYYDEFRSLDGIVDNNKKDILDLYKSYLSVSDFINKYSRLFNSMAQENNFTFLKELNRNLTNKIKRSQKLEKEHGAIPDNDRIDNIEAALKSAYYMFMRHTLNTPLSKGKSAAVFFFVREYCYSSMFRYNKSGQFNVPYGGISYNRKDLQKKINYILSDEMNSKLQTATIHNEDFASFMDKLDLNKDDFIFLDPPYDSDFSTYAKNTFDKKEQAILCDFLKNTKAKIMLVIKNTDYIYNLYKSSFNISSFDKKYAVSFMNRNYRDVKHLMITNY